MVNYQDKKDSEMKKELRLIKMSSVEVEEIQRIWYPYIPCGKVTIIQGDPGNTWKRKGMNRRRLLPTGKMKPLIAEAPPPQPIPTPQHDMEKG